MPQSELMPVIKNIFDFRLFEIGQTTVTPLSLVMFVIMMVIFFLLSWLVRRFLSARLFSRLKIDEGINYALSRFAHYTVLVIGVIIAFQFIGVDLSGLVVIFGLLSVGIGFGLQNVTSNFISGLILLLERPIKVGDRVTVGDTEGDVAEINIRSTTVRSLNNISIIVPNSEFVSSTVVNWSHRDPKVRLDIDVGVSYNSDLNTVLRSLKEVASANQEVLVNPEPEVIFVEFGESSWNMRLRVWINDPKKHWYVRSAINCSIVGKFRENGVEIAFPQRDLHVRSPLPMPFAANYQPIKE